MANTMVMPKLGLSMTEGTILQWFKKEGDTVAKNDETLEIETEKLTYAVPAPIDGVILKIVAEAGAVVPIGQPIAYIGLPGEQFTVSTRDQVDAGVANEPVAPASETQTQSGRIKITPAAKVAALKLNIDWSLVKGTGPGGRITKEDIEAYSQSPATPVVAPLEPPQQFVIGEFEAVGYTGMRKAIGTKMAASWSTAPMVTNHVKADVTELMMLRQGLNAGLQGGQSKLTLTDLLVKITAKAITKMPMVNAVLDEDTIKVLKNINIGVAVSLDSGLIVPVVCDADKKDVFTISKEIRALGEKAKSSSLADEDITGGTFTVTNLGAFGSVDFFTPIVNQPESAILGLGTARKEPAVIDDAVAIRWMMGLSLTYDHRVIDGAPAAKFMAVILELLQNPARAVFEP